MVVTEMVVTGGEMVVTGGETVVTGRQIYGGDWRRDVQWWAPVERVRRWWLVVLLKRRLALDL